MAIKENVLPLAQDSGSGYIRTVSSGGESQRTAFDTVKGAITADMDEAIADEADAREAADDQLQTEIDGKVDKVTGKGLSANDFTNALKTKLDGIEAGAEVNIIETVKVNGTALVPDANRAVNVPAPTVDSALSTSSTNPVQNKVINGAISDLKEDIFNDIIVGDTGWANANFARASDSSVRYLSSNTRISLSQSIHIGSGRVLHIECPYLAKYRLFFFASDISFVDNTLYNIVDAGIDDINYWHTDNRSVIVPDGAVSFSLSTAYTNEETIDPLNPPNFKIYSESITTQIENVKEDVNNTILDSCFSLTSERALSWLQGYINPNGAGTASSTTRCMNDTMLYPFGKFLIVKCPSTIKSRITFWSDTSMSSNNLIPSQSNTVWTNGYSLIAIPDNAKSYRISVAFISDATIVPDDCADIKLYEIVGVPSSYIRGQKISILGDSISTFAGENAETDPDGHLISDGTYTYVGNHCRYPLTYMPYVRDVYWMKLINAFGLVLGINDSWAGSRVSWNGQEGSDYGANIYIASPTRIGHLDDNGTPDIILVNAGTNDIGLNVEVGTFNTESPVNYTDEQIANLPVNTFADAYRALLIRLQKSYPLAKIVVMLPNFTTNYYNPENADLYLEVIKEACDYFGVPWVDMRTTGINMFNTATYTGDGIHPNIEGMNLLFRKIADFFKVNN